MEYVLVGWWLLAFLALSMLAFPLTARLFRSVPGSGTGFAPIVALWWLVVIGYWTGRVGFGRPTLWLALATLAGSSALLGLDRTALSNGRLRIREGITPVDRHAVLPPAVVFVGAFLLVVAIRAADPAVNAAGGEKFLDYGLLRASLRADVVPVYDFWFAGESLNYYYGGHLAAALVTYLTGTDPAFAYNLALAGFYACLATGAFELARAVAAGRVTDRGGDVDAARSSGRYAGAAAAFLVALAGNAVTAVQVVAGVLPGRIGDRFASTMAAGEISAADLRSGADAFFYWDASRVIDGTINEFPLFGFLNGDLHAHMLGAPFLLLAAVVAYAYWRTPAEALRRRRTLVFGVVPLLGGTQVVIHTWDFPTTFGLLWLALAFAPAMPLPLVPGGERVASWLRDRIEAGALATEIERTGGALVVAGLAGVLGALVGAPFLLAASSGQEPALLDATSRSGLGEFLLVHGVFVLGFLAYLIGRLVEDDGARGVLPVVAGIIAVGVVGALSGMPAIGVLIPLLGLGWVALRFGRDVGFETALLVGGAGLVAIVELVYVVEAAGPGRLNTVFKVYFQVWTIWGVALGVVLAELWHGGFRGRNTEDDDARVTEPRDFEELRGRFTGALPSGRVAARAFVVMLVVISAPYAGLALADHFDRNDAGTLHATTFAESEHPEEAAAIAWLDAEATHEDVLLEAPGASRSPEGLAADPGTPGMYTWRANPASSLTGIPTVAGWAHQVGYRGEGVYYDRVAEVDRAYAGDGSDRAAVLDAHDVSYVWVGPTEEARYGDVTFTETGDVVYENDAVRIYRVDDEANS